MKVARVHAHSSQGNPRPQVLSDSLKWKAKFSISRHGPCAKHENWQAHQRDLYRLDILTAPLIWSNGKNWAISHFHVHQSCLLLASTLCVQHFDTEWQWFPFLLTGERRSWSICHRSQSYSRSWADGKEGWCMERIQRSCCCGYGVGDHAKVIYIYIYIYTRLFLHKPVYICP